VKLWAILSKSTSDDFLELAGLLLRPLSFKIELGESMLKVF
jgi:hypothetical protein